MDAKIEVLKNQAFDAYKRKDFAQAAQRFAQCVDTLEKQKDFLNAAEMRNNLSVVLLELKNPNEALSVLENTDRVFAEAGDKKRQAMSLGNMATAMQSLGHFDEALETFEKSSTLFKEIKESELRAITLKKISDLQMKTGKQYQALASLEASYDQHEKKSMKEQILKGFLGNLINKITHRS